MLRNWTERLRREQKGLTLIELTVVVAIIAVLAWLITPRVLDALNNSKTNSALSLAAEIQAALERYAADNDGAYPVTGDLDTFDKLIGNGVSSPLARYLTITTNATELLSASTYNYFAENAPGGGLPPTFCMTLTANDRDTNLIKVQDEGVTNQRDHGITAACTDENG